MDIHEKYQILEQKTYDLYVEYWYLVLESRWENKSDYDIIPMSIWCEIYDMLYLSVHDMSWIIQYNIPKHIVDEYNDRKTWTYMSQRIHDNYDKIQNYNLIMFHRFFEKNLQIK